MCNTQHPHTFQSDLAPVHWFLSIRRDHPPPTGSFYRRHIPLLPSDRSLKDTIKTSDFSLRSLGKQRWNFFSLSSIRLWSHSPLQPQRSSWRPWRSLVRSHHQGSVWLSASGDGQTDSGFTAAHTGGRLHRLTLFICVTHTQVHSPHGVTDLVCDCLHFKTWECDVLSRPTPAACVSKDGLFNLLSVVMSGHMTSS